MNELFPAETVAQLSPRLLWMKKHDVYLHRLAPEFEMPFEAWLQVVNPYHSGYSPVGRGETEEEALVELAKLENIPLWNEEDVSK